MVEGNGGGGEMKLEHTSMWIVSVVFSITVFISLILKWLLHFLGKFSMKKDHKPLFEALQKVKEELMLLGLISPGSALAVDPEDLHSQEPPPPHDLLQPP